MTQLLLFDAPAHSSFPVPAELVQPTTVEREGKEPRRVRDSDQEAAEERDRRENRSVSPEELTPPRGGMHRMGDLANLVIARYEIVAKRRAALLARGPLPSVRF